MLPGIARAARPGRLVLAGAALLIAGQPLLPAAASTAVASTAPAASHPAGSVRPAVSVTSPPGGGGTGRTAPASGHRNHPAASARTVRGPRLWNPKAGKSLAQHSEVTVDQAADLTNQVIHVSWRHFTPSSQTLYDADSTDYPVMIAECRGTHPTRWSQCFGADNGGVAGSFSAYGPMNTAYATSSRRGTGQADIQLLTAQEDQQLGCDVGKPCSLVVVPSQGGNVFDSPPHCRDHSQDTGQSDIGAIAFSSATGGCSARPTWPPGGPARRPR